MATSTMAGAPRTPLRVLLLAGCAADGERVIEHLRDAGFDPDWRQVDSEHDYLARLDPTLDLILAEYSLPSFNALDALRCLRERRLDIPLIVVSGVSGEALAVESVKAGADDYLLKDRLQRLGGAVVRALEDRRRREAFRRTEEALGTSEARFRGLLHALPDAVVTVNREGRIVFAGVQVERLFGYTWHELLGQPVEMLLPERLRDVHAGHRALFEQDPRARPMGVGLALTGRRRDGSEVPVEISLGPFRTNGEVLVTSLIRDVTEQKKAEAVLRESEARYRGLFENVLEGVFQSLPDGTLLTVNQPLVEMLGYSLKDELLGVNATTLYVDPNAPNVFADELRRTGNLRNFETALQRKDGGALTVLVNARLVREGPGTAYVEGTVTDITKRVLAAEALKQSEERYREMFMNDLTGAYVATPAGRLIACNPALVSMLGLTSIEEALRIDLPSGYKRPEDREAFLEALRAERRIEAREMEYQRPDGKPLHVIESVVGVFDRRGDLIEMRGYLVDTTHRKQLEDQLRQAQKMEAVGRLAGGIAHDFNNIMTAILGFSEFLLDSLAPDAPARADVEEIKKAGQRAADLTRQLLAFSRRQVVRPVILDVNVVVKGMDRLVRSLIGEDLELLMIMTDENVRVKIDPGQLEQIVANLAVNARDAMRDGGTLTVETSVVQLNELGGGRFGSRRGRYVLIAVSDTGTGIDAETLPHIFDPFFTTKEIGRGTGLGLSTVYGIVKQAEGFIDVHSAPGGTTFKIYLPWTDEPIAPADGAPRVVNRVLCDLTILVVEDDAAVRDLIRKTLAAEGCRILEAGNGSEALALLEQRGTPVDLVLTDIVMPGMSGRALADQVGRLYPDLKILFMSGYPSTLIASHGVLDRGLAFLEKPFSPDDLKAKVIGMLR